MNENNDSAGSKNVRDGLCLMLKRCAREWRPLLVAAVARMAAERYRDWAATPTGKRYRSRLLTCAKREEDIARVIEALYQNATRIEDEILRKTPDLAISNVEAFPGRPLGEQLLLQARQARLGVATWRALAEQEHDHARRGAFLACADLEELNALALEEAAGGLVRISGRIGITPRSQTPPR